LVRSKFFLVEVVENLSLHLKQLELGQKVLRYSNPDRIRTLSGPPGNLKWDLVWTSRHCLLYLCFLIPDPVMVSLYSCLVFDALFVHSHISVDRCESRICSMLSELEEMKAYLKIIRTLAVGTFLCVSSSV